MSEEIRKAMDLAFHLGQTYWQQADHEFISQQRKSDTTRQKFNDLRDNTCAQHSAALAARDERVRELEAGLREVEQHHVYLNRKAYREESKSETLRIVRRALLAPPGNGGA